MWLKQTGQAIARTPHTLKGSSRNAGAVGMAAMCESLERLGDDGSRTKAMAMVADLEHEFSQLRRLSLKS